MPVILDAIKRGESVQHYETAQRRKVGTAIDVSLTVLPVRDESGWTFGASKIARDITERKRV
jgi:PAS domain S-box-containing protein